MVFACGESITGWSGRMNGVETKERAGTTAAAAVILFLVLFYGRRERESGQVFRGPSDIPSNILMRLDAVLVLGGGVPKSVDEPPVYVQRRCDDAAAVLKRHCDSSQSKVSLLPILALSAGTAYLPQLMSKDGLPVWESTSSAAYLQKRHGLRNVYVETTSYDTIGNAYYARTGHTDINGWRRLLIVTNEFHMDRTKIIFDWIFGIGNNGYELCYLSSDDNGLTERALQARRAHEVKGANSVAQNLVPQYKTLKDVWEFLNHKHDLYAASKLVDRARQANASGVRCASLEESYGAR